MPDIKSSGTDWDTAPKLTEWENHYIAGTRLTMLGDFDDADTVAEKPIRLTYMGAGPAEDVDPRLLDHENVSVPADRQVTAWRLRYPEPESLEISTKPGDGNGQTATFEGSNVELLRGRMYVRPGVPAALMLGMAAIWCRGFQVGKRKMNKEKRSRLYRQFHELLGYALENMPQIDATPKEHEDMQLDVRDDVLERLEEARDEMTGAYHVDLPAFTVEVEEDEDEAPPPQVETPDYDPDPHTGPNDTAGLLAGSFSNIMTGAIMDASGDPAPTKQGEWGRGPGGGPVRVEKLKNPYEGRAVLKVQAHADADPAEVEAAMGWEMLERMDMDTVWLHALLLGHASAPHRRGDRSVMEIPRKRVENALGIRRNRNMTVQERAVRVKKHVEALQSLSVQFQGVRRHGDKLHFEGDMTASPLWFVQMKAKGQKDLFTGEVTADWYVQAKEGVWGSEFLHNHGDQWTPLPKEWFDQIDRRGKDWTQRLAVALLFLFRINAKRGGRVKLSAEKMLDICGTDMEGSSRRRTERKRRLSKALDALRKRYNIGVEAGRVHIDNTSGIDHADWKSRTATFHPPDEMSGELFRNEDDGRPPLPDVKGGDWTAAQIKQLRSDLGDTQSEFAEKLGVSRQMVSRYENRHDPPSDDVRKTLDRLDSRFR